MIGYDLGDVLPKATLGSVPTGTSVLLVGPPLIGTSRLALDLLAVGHDAGEGAIVVSTEHRAERVRGAFEDRVVDFDADRLGVVDCRSGQAGDHPESTDLVRYVSSPGNLTDIGVAIISCMDEFERNGIDRTRLAFTSLSTLLSYVDRESVFKFCHVLTARLDSADAFGVFTIDENAHDARTVTTITRAFDGVIELREGDGGVVECRVVGMDASPTAWTPL